MTRQLNFWEGQGFELPSKTTAVVRIVRKDEAEFAVQNAA